MVTTITTTTEPPLEQQKGPPPEPLLAPLGQRLEPLLVRQVLPLEQQPVLLLEQQQVLPPEPLLVPPAPLLAPLLAPPAPQPVPLQVLPLELPEPLLELLGRPPLADQFCNQVQTKPSKRPCQGVFLIKLSYEVDPRSTDKVVLARFEDLFTNQACNESMGHETNNNTSLIL